MFCELGSSGKTLFFDSFSLWMWLRMPTACTLLAQEATWALDSTPAHAPRSPSQPFSVFSDFPKFYLLVGFYVLRFRAVAVCYLFLP